MTVAGCQGNFVLPFLKKSFSPKQMLEKVKGGGEGGSYNQGPSYIWTSAVIVSQSPRFIWAAMVFLSGSRPRSIIILFLNQGNEGKRMKSLIWGNSPNILSEIWNAWPWGQNWLWPQWLRPFVLLVLVSSSSGPVCVYSLGSGFSLLIISSSWENRPSSQSVLPFVDPVTPWPPDPTPQTPPPHSIRPQLCILGNVNKQRVESQSDDPSWKVHSWPWKRWPTKTT